MKEQKIDLRRGHVKLNELSFPYDSERCSFAGLFGSDRCADERIYCNEEDGIVEVRIELSLF